MEAKKSIKIIAVLAVGAIIVFFSVLLLNDHIDSKGDNVEAADLLGASSENQQSFTVPNMPQRNDDDFVAGPGGKALDVIVYEDYADPFSAQFAEVLDRAKGEFGKRVNFVYRPYHVDSSDLSRLAAQAIFCAADQHQGEDYRSKVFAAARADQLNQEKLLSLAAEAGISEEFAPCLTNVEKKEKIEQLAEGADNFSVMGAPTVFIGDEMIVGARPYEAFTDSNGDEIEGLKQVIERQLK